MRYLPMGLRLPGTCSVCRRPVIFDGKRWTDRPKVAHACPSERAVCGAVMRNARERCARRPGHKYDHRTRYAMDNALEMQSGHRKAA